MNSRLPVLCSLLVFACSRTPRADHQPTPAPLQAAEVAAPLAALPANGPSLTDLPITLVDQAGKAVSFADFSGDPLIVSMFYSSCPYTCPMLISRIKGAEQALDPGTRSRLHVVMVSFDSDHDTPAVLARVAQQHQVNSSRWHLAHASDADVRTLAAVLGIRYKKLADGAFSHSSVITVLDGRAVARFRQDDLNAPPTGVARAIESVALSARTAMRAN